MRESEIILGRPARSRERADRGGETNLSGYDAALVALPRVLDDSGDWEINLNEALAGGGDHGFGLGR